MTDRELLELAAKAAGIDGPVDDWWEMGDQHYVGIRQGAWGVWNPLTDDGDAFRLAVKLGFVVNCPVRQDGRDAASVFRGNMLAQESGEPLAATRRAIVRAAAATAP